MQQQITRDYAPEGETVCSTCEGKGYTGHAYWDEELEWMMFSKDSAPCTCCDGKGVMCDDVPVALNV